MLKPSNFISNLVKKSNVSAHLCHVTYLESKIILYDNVDPDEKVIFTEMVSIWLVFVTCFGVTGNKSPATSDWFQIVQTN